MVQSDGRRSRHSGDRSRASLRFAEFMCSKAGIQTTYDEAACVYLLASRRHGPLCVGVTSDLIKRVWEHKQGLVEGFTQRYQVHRLVWFELHETMESAIRREKAIKEWKRRWKLALIESKNPGWRDLYDDLA